MPGRGSVQAEEAEEVEAEPNTNIVFPPFGFTGSLLDPSSSSSSAPNYTAPSDAALRGWTQTELNQSYRRPIYDSDEEAAEAGEQKRSGAVGLERRSTSAGGKAEEDVQM